MMLGTEQERYSTDILNSKNFHSLKSKVEYLKI